MSDPRDFQLGAAKPVGSSQQPDEAAPEPDDAIGPDSAQPMVVIEYRNRGIPTYLIPPLLIILAALGIMSYQHLTPPGPIAAQVESHRVARPPMPASAGGKGRTIEVESADRSADSEPIVVKSEAPKPAEPVAERPVPRPEPPAVPVAEPPAKPLTVVETAPPKPANPPDEVVARGPITIPRDLFDLTSAAGLKPVSDGAEPSNTSVAPAPSSPREILVDPPSTGAAEPKADAEPESEPDAARTGIGFSVPAEDATLISGAATVSSNPTVEDTERDIRREAEAREAEREELARLKPQALEIEKAEARRRAFDDRISFRRDLRQIVQAGGRDAGRQIETLCQQYGYEVAPEVRERVATRLRLSTERMSRKDEVEMFRAHGIPEAAILNYLQKQAHNRLYNARAGARDPDEIRVSAAKELLSYPFPSVREKKPAKAATPKVVRSAAGTPAVRSPVQP